MTYQYSNPFFYNICQLDMPPSRAVEVLHFNHSQVNPHSLSSFITKLTAFAIREYRQYSVMCKNQSPRFHYCRKIAISILPSSILFQYPNAHLKPKTPQSKLVYCSQHNRYIHLTASTPASCTSFSRANIEQSPTRQRTSRDVDFATIAAGFYAFLFFPRHLIACSSS